MLAQADGQTSATSTMTFASNGKVVMKFARKESSVLLMDSDNSSCSTLASSIPVLSASFDPTYDHLWILSTDGALQQHTSQGTYWTPPSQSPAIAGKATALDALHSRVQSLRMHPLSTLPVIDAAPIPLNQLAVSILSQIASLSTVQILKNDLASTRKLQAPSHNNLLVLERFAPSSVSPAFFGTPTVSTLLSFSVSDKVSRKSSMGLCSIAP